MPAAAKATSQASSAPATTSGARAAAAAEARVGRYREAERTLWEHYGLEPAERFLELGSPAVRLRVQEVGSGEPVLFVHGTGGPGTWPSLVRELDGVRCILLDRPGWGPSSPVDYSATDYNALVADLLRGVLDALGLDRAHVAGASIGNNWALRLAQRHPSRVARTVLLGGGPLLPEIRIPPFIRLLASPAGAVMVRLPQKPKMLHAQLRGLGHGASLDTGRIPDAFIDWRMALTRETDSMRHERSMVRAIASPRGFRPGLTFKDAELAQLAQRTLHVFGTADPVGTPDAWRRAAGLLPQGELCLIDDAGHVPWFEDPSRVAREVRRFLAT
jgi:2-hydroxy-6-oxonona-2,4-dienedioate hydrolase